MNLSTLQQEFIRQLSNPTQPDDFLGHLKPCGNLLPEQQIEIYKNNVRGTLQKTLAQVYPVCHKILGENYFKQIARSYIAEHPSNHHDLNLYGEYFSAFIQTQCQLREELYDFPYLGDLAQLEWFQHQAYYAAQRPAFDLAAFAQLTEEQYTQVTFQLAPDIKFMASDYPLVSIWQLNQLDSDNRQTITAESESYCIFRNQYRVEINKIDQEVFNLLDAIASGTPLDTISEIDSNNNLPELIRSGWVCGFKVNHV